MEYGTKFKRSLFGGFKREDVLKCFEEMSEEKTNEIDDLHAKLKKSEEELSAAREALTQTQTEKAAVEEANANLQLEIGTLKEQLTAEQSKIKELSAAEEQAAAESKASLQLLKERDVKIAFLEDKAQKLTLKLETSENKSQKYERLSVEIGEMMLEAKQSAEAIIHQAKLRADQMTAETDLSVDTLSMDLDSFLQQLGRIKSNLHTLLGSVDNQIQTIEASLTDAQKNIQSYRSAKPAAPQAEAKTVVTDAAEDQQPASVRAEETDAYRTKPHFFR